MFERASYMVIKVDARRGYERRLAEAAFTQAAATHASAPAPATCRLEHELSVCRSQLSPRKFSTAPVLSLSSSFHSRSQLIYGCRRIPPICGPTLAAPWTERAFNSVAQYTNRGVTYIARKPGISSAISELYANIMPNFGLDSGRKYPESCLRRIDIASEDYFSDKIPQPGRKV